MALFKLRSALIALGVVFGFRAVTPASAATITYIAQGVVSLDEDHMLARDLFGEFGPKNGLLTGKSFQSIMSYHIPNIYPAHGTEYGTLTSASLSIGNKTKYFTIGSPGYYEYITMTGNSFSSNVSYGVDLYDGVGDTGLSINLSSVPSSTLYSSLNIQTSHYISVHSGHYVRYQPSGLELTVLSISGFYSIYSQYDLSGRRSAADFVSSVSYVPLPSSAPTFGAALLVLGTVGYAVRRKKTAVV